MGDSDGCPGNGDSVKPFPFSCEWGGADGGGGGGGHVQQRSSQSHSQRAEGLVKPDYSLLYSCGTSTEPAPGPVYDVKKSFFFSLSKTTGVFLSIKVLKLLRSGPFKEATMGVHNCFKHNNALVPCHILIQHWLTINLKLFGINFFFFRLGL